MSNGRSRRGLGVRLLALVLGTLVGAGVFVWGTRPTSPALSPGEIEPDEVAHLFPTLARWTSDGDLVVPIHGWLYAPERESVVRRLALEASEEFFEGAEDGPERLEEESEARLHERLGLFMVDAERGKSVRVRVAHRVVRSAPSNAKGHFVGETVFGADSPLARSLASSAPCTFPAAVVLPDGDGRVMKGRFLVPARENGVAIVCDLDDTLKVSNVRSERELFSSTFWEEWRAVEGMPELLIAISRATGATTHYLTAARWPLQGEYAAFLEAEGCPYGSFHMREFDFDLRDLSFARDGAQEHKRGALNEIAAALPEHEFVLIGDSTEADPEVYGAFAREHPGRVRAVLIRLVGEDRPTDERFAACFEGVDPARVVLFSQAPAFEEVAQAVSTPLTRN